MGNYLSKRSLINHICLRPHKRFVLGPLSFQNASTTETCLKDFHKCISRFFKSHHLRLKSKIVYYRDYKNFNQSTLLKKKAPMFLQILMTQTNSTAT